MILTGSVGEGGVNRRQDVKYVQRLLNDWLGRLGEPGIAIDGRIGNETIGAINKFQRLALGFSFPDSLVEPGLNTIRALQEMHIAAIVNDLHPEALPYATAMVAQLSQLETAPLCRETGSRLAGPDGEELRVVLVLVQDGHEPVAQLQISRSHHFKAVRIIIEGGLPCQHRIAHATSLCQAFVKRLNKAAGGLHQHTVTHRYHRAHPFLEQLGSHRGHGIFD